MNENVIQTQNHKCQEQIVDQWECQNNFRDLFYQFLISCVSFSDQESCNLLSQK